MGIIQLLINEGYEDKKKQQVVAETLAIIKELNNGDCQNEDTAESEEKNDPENKPTGAERG